MNKYKVLDNKRRRGKVVAASKSMNSFKFACYKKHPGKLSSEAAFDIG